jgi:hypothetical protein
MSKHSKTVLSILFILALVVSLSASAQMGKPKMATLSGKVIDLTCSAKAKTMMNSWTNAENDEHMTPDGKKPGCATMCLKGGQPAALFNGKDIVAVFGCNPRATLSNYAAKDVEVTGFWGGGKGAKTFIPQKIRSGSGEWQDVDCATMH